MIEVFEVGGWLVVVHRSEALGFQGFRGKRQAFAEQESAVEDQMISDPVLAAFVAEGKQEVALKDDVRTVAGQNAVASVMAHLDEPLYSFGRALEDLKSNQPLNHVFYVDLKHLWGRDQTGLEGSD